MTELMKKPAPTNQTAPLQTERQALGKAQATTDQIEKHLIKVSDDFSFWYGKNQVLFDLNLAIPNRKVTALIDGLYSSRILSSETADDMLNPS